MTVDNLIAIAAILLALGFDFVNGFHDTANAVATVIYTKALRPAIAIAMSGVLNFLGAVLVGTAVAMVITKIVHTEAVTMHFIVSVLLAAVMWNLVTWWYGLPVSSSHCLIGSLFGAGIAAHGVSAVNWHELDKVLIALLVSPILGFTAGLILTWITWNISGERTLERSQTRGVGRPIMRGLHILSSAALSFSHGSNDGQKTMGIITLILAVNFSNCGYRMDHVPFWVMAAAATAIAMGTIVGGWRVIRTVGSKISKERLSHSQGFGASMSTAAIIIVASAIGAPISTTHTLSSAVAGSTVPVYGASSLNAKTLNLIVMAWVLTLPVAASFSSLSYAISGLFWR